MNLKRYYEEKALNYGISKKREQRLMQILPSNLGGKRILELGCATGYFGKKLIDKGAFVYGVDISKKAIKEASKVLTKAFVLNIEEDNFPFKANYFDIIIVSEVLEHLFKPIDFLRKLNKLLKKNSDLIISTPNLLYWGNRINFLKGNFQYEKEGVFDEGHIHFYSYKSLKKELKDTGFEVLQENNLYIGNSKFNLIKNKYPGLFSYQFIFRCKEAK